MFFKGKFFHISSIEMKPRVTLENLAVKKGITEPREKTTESLIKLLLSKYLLYRKELTIIAKNLSIKKPNKLSSNELVNIFKNYLTVKKLEELGLNTLKKKTHTNKRIRLYTKIK